MKRKVGGYLLGSHALLPQTGGRALPHTHHPLTPHSVPNEAELETPKSGTVLEGREQGSRKRCQDPVLQLLERTEDKAKREEAREERLPAVG